MTETTAPDGARFVSPCPPPTPAEREVSDLVAEECAEVIQRVTKLTRFGVQEIQPGQPHTNAVRLSHEVGDLMEVLDLALRDGLVLTHAIEEGRVRKRAQLTRFLQHATPPSARGRSAGVVLPEEPTVEMLRCISRSRHPQDWMAGQQAKARLEPGVIPHTYEMEAAYGQYLRLREAARAVAAPASLAADRGFGTCLTCHAVLGDDHTTDASGEAFCAACGPSLSLTQAVEVMTAMYRAVTGKVPEWGDTFTWAEGQEEVERVMASRSASPAAGSAEAMREDCYVRLSVEAMRLRSLEGQTHNEDAWKARAEAFQDAADMIRTLRPAAPPQERAARGEVEALRAHLAIAARQFRFYERQHRAKVPLTQDTIDKADVNKALAEQMDAALTPPPRPDERGVLVDHPDDLGYSPEVPSPED